jgi:hypothetical protein
VPAQQPGQGIIEQIRKKQMWRMGMGDRRSPAFLLLRPACHPSPSAADDSFPFSAHLAEVQAVHEWLSIYPNFFG